MRNIKSFLVSGITLCVLYLIVHSTFLSTSFVEDTQAQGIKIYSPFTLSSAADAEDTQVEEQHDDAAPAEEHQDATPAEAAPAEQPAPEQPAPAEQPAAPAPEQAPAAPAPAPAPAAPAPAPAAPAPAAPAAPAPAPAPAAAPTAPDASAPVGQVPAPAAAPTAPDASALVGQVPAAPAQEAPPPPPPPEEPKEELVGFDTIDLAEPSGNWLLKRGIWERAQSKYEQVKGVFDQVLEARMPFFKRRAEVDRQILDPLYISAGLDQEQIASILEEFNTLLSVDLEKHKQLDEREKKMQMAAIEEKKVLEQLQKDVADLDKYAKALDAFLDKLIEQVNLGRAAEKQAWQTYKDIAKELNDKTARELYDSIATPFARLTNIQGYINGVFKQEFDKVDKTIQDNATRIKNALQSLKEKGLDLKKFSKELDEKLGQEEKLVCPTHEEPQEEGWVGMLTSWWNSFQEGLVGIYDSVMGYFSSGESEEQVVEPKKKKHTKADEKPAEQTTPAQPAPAAAE
jgi:hypothetical protein